MKEPAPERLWARRGAATVFVGLGVTFALVATLVLILANDPAKSPAAVPVRTAACSDILLVGLTGSAERPSATAPFGRSLEAWRSTYVAAAVEGDRTVTQEYVGRWTPSVYALKKAPGITGTVPEVVSPASVKRWEGDLAEAAGNLVQVLLDAAAECPDQQIVLGGYAQGAMVVHRAMIRLPSHPGVWHRVVAAVLVSDGDRVADTRAIRSGSPIAGPAARGVQSYFRSARPDVPTGRSPIVWSVCTRGDLACNVRTIDVRRAIQKHLGYGSGEEVGVLKRIAGLLWGRTTRWARPVAGWSASPGSMGVPLVRKVPVLVNRDDRDSVAFSNVANLPPGLDMSEAGRITGTPTAAGTWLVRFDVSNLASPVFDQPVAGAARLRILNKAPRSLSAGGEHSCAVRYDGSAWCWGRNTWGQIGNGETGPGPDVPSRVGELYDWRSIAAGGGDTCGIRDSGALFCWGLDHRGQLGDGRTRVHKYPQRIGDARNWSQISLGWFTTCGVRDDGTAWCWGDNSAGQLGDGSTTIRKVPTRLPGTGWTSISVGGWHVCATKDDGGLWCWGRNTFGQVGNGTTRDQHTPTRIGSDQWSSVSTSWSHTCGVLASGGVRCWGRNSRGQLGDGSRTDHSGPTAVGGLAGITEVAAGEGFTCALDQDARAWCWGSNDYGTLQTGATTSSSTPVQGEVSFRSLSAGWMHACGVTMLGPSACWGNNERGQLGDGTTSDRPDPTPQEWP